MNILGTRAVYALWQSSDRPTWDGFIERLAEQGLVDESVYPFPPACEDCGGTFEDSDGCEVLSFCESCEKWKCQKCMHTSDQCHFCDIDLLKGVEPTDKVIKIFK